MLNGPVDLLAADSESVGPGAVWNGALIPGELHDVWQVLPVGFLVRLAGAGDGLALEAANRNFSHPVALQSLLAVLGEASVCAADIRGGRASARLILALDVMTAGGGSASDLGARHMALLLLFLLRLRLRLQAAKAQPLRGALQHSIGC